MANYYTREVVTEPINLTRLMQYVLETRSARVDQIEPVNILDAMVTGKLAHKCYVTFEEGWSEADPEELKDYYVCDGAPWPHEWDEENQAEFDRLLAMEKQDFFREVLKINPQTNYIELQAAWSCSKMRLDGFGGSSLHISRKGFLYVSTTDVVMDEHGQFFCGAEFHPWEDLDD